MEAIGRLAGGIAHDFNNLLTVILGYSEVALGASDVAEARRAAEEVAAAAKSAAALTGQLLAFSRQQVLQPQVLELAGVLTSTEGLLRRLLGEDVELVVSVADDARPILVDPSQIEQVVLNLAVNAREAMPDGGTLQVEVTNVDVDERSASIHVGLESGPYVGIAVSDTGLGMDEETRSRIFEPFFTTKVDGTGLGLATVHGVVTQSGGYVQVESSPGAGTTFRMLFPAADPDPLSLTGDEPGAAEAGDCAKTILVVEDEDPVRTLTTKVLADSGYTVLAAATPAEAVDIASGWREPLHLILSDITLPGGSGHDLTAELRQLHPEAKALLISGYAPVKNGHNGDGPQEPFLSKPFTAAGLKSKVREILAA
jgi:two-component system cell cycle sensor histidine kinase/response regulator CckA